MLAAIRSMDGKRVPTMMKWRLNAGLWSNLEFADERRRNFDLHILTSGPN